MFRLKIIFHLLIIFSCVAVMPSCSPKGHGSKYSSAHGKKKSEHKTRKPNDSGTYVFKTKPVSKKNPEVSFVKPVSATRENIIISARKYIGKPYKPGGKKPETGFDCSGFTGYVFTQNGFPISGASQDIAKMGKQKSRDQLIPGDLVFFGNAERISHVAIVSFAGKDKLEVIHSTTSAGVKTDIINGSPYWESRYLFGVDVIDSL